MVWTYGSFTGMGIEWVNRAFWGKIVKYTIYSNDGIGSSKVSEHNGVF